ncbi:MAG: LacI family DNA-binding transcriptional regulator [Rubrivivax sp.]
MATRAGSAPTITDVAEQSGVSIKTVSRVLNREANVLPETRELVLEVVRRLNYRPKQSARSLAGGRSFLIGLLYYDPSAAFVGGVQRGATLACRDAGYHLVVESLGTGAPDIDEQVDRMLAALRPDGMILTPPLCDDPRVLATVNAARTPCVLISPGNTQPAMARVLMDDVRAAEELGNLLVSLGHERIGFIEGAPDQAAAAWRRRGFEQALRAHGLALDPALVLRGDFTFPSGEAAAHALLSQRQPPTAVFASNDDMALGVLAAAQRLGIQVPQDLSIVGFDDSPAASLVWPALTTVRQPVGAMAAAAVQMLIDGKVPVPGADGQISDAPVRVLPHELVVRASTRALKRPGM